VPQQAWAGRLGSLKDSFVTHVPEQPGAPGPVVAASPSPGRGADRPGRGQASPQARGQRAPASGHSGGPATRMTARGAVLAMLSLFFPGTLTAGWLHFASLTGISFVAGCVVAARYTRRDGMLTAVVAPPLLFFVALVSSELLTSHEDTIGHSLTSAAEGTILTLAAVAPWLFAGVLIGLVIAMFNGLPQCVRDMHAALRVDPGLPAPPDSARG
jgi:hypothetical protein